MKKTNQTYQIGQQLFFVEAMYHQIMDTFRIIESDYLSALLYEPKSLQIIVGSDFTTQSTNEYFIVVRVSLGRIIHSLQLCFALPIVLCRFRTVTANQKGQKFSS
jgi:hypothetical protein